MKTEIINFKVDKATKRQAQKMAKQLGISLSSVINGYLKHFIKTKEVHFTLEPTEYLKRALRESERDIREGKISPAFKTVEEEIAWLNDPHARYADGSKV